MNNRVRFIRKLILTQNRSQAVLFIYERLAHHAWWASVRRASDGLESILIADQWPIFDKTCISPTITVSEAVVAEVASHPTVTSAVLYCCVVWLLTSRRWTNGTQYWYTLLLYCTVVEVTENTDITQPTDTTKDTSAIL